MTEKGLVVRPEPEPGLGLVEDPNTVIDVEFLLGERAEPKQSERMLEAER